ncbi:MAG: TraB/GumN family protein [Lewinellaceae bacterium]|nr:TraB/GumN family protein [Lewinellaceae bacterium]
MLRPLLPLLITAAALPLTAQQQQPEKLKGLLWEVSGNGIAKNGYLYGTMHVPEKMAFNLSDSFFVALHAVDVVALETDHDRWQAFSEILDGQANEIFGGGYGGYHSGQPNLYHTQFDFSPPDNQLLGAVLSAKPRMTNEFLYRTNQYRQDHEEDTYLDLFIFQAGRKLGKTVIGLETLEGSFEALIRSQLPEDEDEAEENPYLAAFSQTTIEDAYRDQDLSLLDSLNMAAQPGKNFRRWMLDERNFIMANGIDSILQSGSAVFAAVGAAHLPGETGLIPLLREKGYALRPVQFSANTSKQTKEAIENMRYPVLLSRQWATDSVWSAVAPGMFFETMNGSGVAQHLCTDMNNGAYYTVSRLRTNGLWNGQSPAYIAQRIDSLIYEKIPGKIQERRQLTAPFPGHEITTRTRRGDIMRFKILVLPMEILVFSIGGNGDYAAGDEADRFLRSIQLRQTDFAGKPTAVQPEQGGFRVVFPAEPVFNTTSDNKSDRQMVAALDPADSAFYLVYRAVYHDWSYIEEDTFELNIIGEKIAGMFTKATPTSNLLSPAPYPTQDIVFQSDRDSAWYFLRLVINGPHYYLLGCRKKTPGAPTAFFESFALEPYRYPQGWELLRDSTLLFEAMAPPIPEPPGKAFIEKLKTIVQEGMKKQRQEEYDQYEQTADTRTVRVSLQGDNIFVHALKLPVGGFAPTLDSFQAFVQKRLTNAGKLTVREQHWGMPGERLLVGDLLLEDTNSTRGIRNRVFLTPGRMYTISATVHLDAQPDAFVNKFFDTFVPTDTTAGILPFGRPNLDFLQNLYAEDSLVQEKACGQLLAGWSHALEPTDFAAIQESIVHPKFGQMRYKYRQALLAALGEFQTPEALRFALHLWLQHPDSARYRQELLVSITNMETRPAYETLIWMLKQRSVFASENSITEIFSVLNDSLELSVQFLPDLLALAEVHTLFQDYTYRLAATALERGLLKARVYVRLKPKLVAESYRQIGNKQLSKESRQDASDTHAMFGYEDDTDLERNLKLLAPFLPKDKSVRALFEQAARCPDQQVQVLSRCLMLQQGMPVERETLREYAADDKTRFMLYANLAQTDQLALYASWFTDTLALVRSILHQEFVNSENGLDSVHFLRQYRTPGGSHPAVTYFFDVKKKKDKDCRLAYVTVPLASATFAAPSRLEKQGDYGQQNPEVRILSELSSEKEKAEYIEKYIGAVRFEGRERYETWAGDQDDSYFMEE